MTARARLLRLVGIVLAIDALAILIYYLAGLERAAPGVRQGFTAAWTGLTLVVVLTQLGRLRRERLRRRHGVRP